MSFRALFLFFFCAIGKALAVEVISNLIVFYDPRGDQNQAFAKKFYDELNPVIQAAREKNLKVVLVNVNSWPKGKQEFLSRFKKTIQDQEGKSFVFMNTHGGDQVTFDNLKEHRNLTDTSLVFNQSVLYSSLADTLEDPSVSGVLVNSCNSFNEYLKRGGPPIRCATNNMGKTSSSASAFYFTAMTELIARKDPILLASEFKGSVTCQMLGPHTPYDWADEKVRSDWDVSEPGCDFKAPIVFSPEVAKKLYQFSGKKFELVDEKNKSLLPCSAGKHSVLPGDYATSSLLNLESVDPHKLLPWPGLEEQDEKNWLTMKWTDGPITRCENGKLSLIMPENCNEIGISYPLKKSKTTNRYELDFNPKGDQFVAANVNEIKNDTEQMINIIVEAGIKIPNTYCIRSCRIHEYAALVQGNGNKDLVIPAGACDPKGYGFYCNASRRNYYLKPSSACCNPPKDSTVVKDSQSGECRNTCPDGLSDIPWEQRGEKCFALKTGISTYESSVSMYLLQNDLASPLPAYTCVGQQGKGEPQFSDKCCKKAGGEVLESKSLMKLVQINDSGLGNVCYPKSSDEKEESGSHKKTKATRESKD